jgi:nucleoside-diphosphate-sugar epimerase
MVDNSMSAVKAGLKGKRILLVGGAGFIGHHLALALREQEADVMVVDNLMINGVIENLYRADRDPVQRAVYQKFLLERFSAMRDAGIHLRNCDARMFLDLNQIFAEFVPDKVVHLAGIASAVDAAKDPGLTFDVGLTTLRHSLEAVRASQGRIDQIMFLSSSTVYGDFETASVDESVRPAPKGIYANLKYMGERLMRTYRDSYGVGTTIVRPSALYGERCISRRVSQVFIENALTGKPLPMEGGGAGRLDFTYIHDLVEGMVRALGLPGGVRNTFNLTFGNSRSIAELVAVIRTVIPDLVVLEKPAAPDKPKRGTLSTVRAEEMLGFKARWTLEEGYGRYCKWYKNEWQSIAR